MFRMSRTGGCSRTAGSINGCRARDCVQTAEACCKPAVALRNGRHLFLRRVSAVSASGSTGKAWADSGPGGRGNHWEHFRRAW